MTDETVPDVMEPESTQDSQPPHSAFMVWFTVALMVILVALILYLALFGNQVPVPADLTHSLWTLQSYTNQNGTLIPVLAGISVTAGFGANDRVTGSTGCNQYSANYTLQGYFMEISQPDVTKRYCSGIMQQESVFLSDLPKSTEYRINGVNLEIYDKDGKTIFVFRSS